MRQVDDRSCDRAAPAADVGQRAARRHRAHRARGRGAAQAAAPDADDLPGPDLVAEPRAAGRRHRRRGPRHLGDRRQGDARRRRSTRCSTAVGIDPANAGAATARVLRRPVPAHLDRPRGRDRAEADHLRRAGLGARRVGAGPDPQPAPGHEGPLRPDARVHRPRPRGGEERERPGRGDVPRQDVRGRATGRDLRAPGSSVHRRAARRDPGARSRRAAPTRRRCSAARSRHRWRRRVAAGSAPAAPRRRSSARPRSPSCARSSDDHFVACHFPLAPGEQLDFAKVGVGATIGLDEDTDDLD